MKAPLKFLVCCAALPHGNRSSLSPISMLKAEGQHFGHTSCSSSALRCKPMKLNTYPCVAPYPLPCPPPFLSSSPSCGSRAAFPLLPTSSPPPPVSQPSLSLSSCLGAVTCLKKPNRPLQPFLTGSCCVRFQVCVCVCELSV